MKIQCSDCHREYDDADCTTICPHDLLMPREDLNRKDAAAKILGRLVRRSEIHSSRLVVAITSRGMVWLEGELGEFDPKDLIVVPMREDSHPIKLDLGMQLWKEWFEWSGDPWTAAGRDCDWTDCFFCGEDEPKHSDNCIYERVRLLLIQSGHLQKDENTPKSG